MENASHVVCSVRRDASIATGRIMAAGAGPNANPGTEGPGASRYGPRRVLIVDDEPELAELAQVLLSNFGFETRVAHCALEALQVLASDPDIDAVFSDVMMPGMSGLELAELLGRLYPSLKLVLTSGFIVPSLRSKLARPYLFAAKPYKIETVIALLRS